MWLRIWEWLHYCNSPWRHRHLQLLVQDCAELGGGKSGGVRDRVALVAVAECETAETSMEGLQSASRQQRGRGKARLKAALSDDGANAPQSAYSIMIRTAKARLMNQKNQKTLHVLGLLTGDTEHPLLQGHVVEQDHLRAQARTTSVTVSVLFCRTRPGRVCVRRVYRHQLARMRIFPLDQVEGSRLVSALASHTMT